MAVELEAFLQVDLALIRVFDVSILLEPNSLSTWFVGRARLFYL